MLSWGSQLSAGKSCSCTATEELRSPAAGVARTVPGAAQARDRRPPRWAAELALGSPPSPSRGAGGSGWAETISAVMSSGERYVLTNFNCL